MADLNPRQKAAAVLLALDSETAASVLKNFDEDDLMAVTREMSALGDLDPQDAAGALYEFSQRAAQEQSISATPEVLRERLQLAVGEDGARNLLQEIGLDHSAEEIFRSLHDLSPEELSKILLDEHPQTISLVLIHLEPRHAAAVLSQFSPDLQRDIVSRMARSQHAEESLLKRVGDLIRTKVGMLGKVRKSPEDPRYKKVAEIINLLGPTAEDEILKPLAGDAPDMVKKLREMMFVFTDITSLSDADMRKVLMSIDTQMLAMALKTATEEIKQKVFANLSRRATETLTEELELLGPKPLSQVKAAQQQLVETIRKMDSSGEINIRGSKYEEDPLV
jgi:flagellar motor switch protein FliG